VTVHAPPSVAAQLAATIADEGCEHLFTLMGAGNLWVIHHLATEHGTAIHHLRHENGAVGAADGHARATGEIGWCTVTQGPGFTNTITALLTASRGRSPVILLVSDTSNLDPERFPFAGGVQALPPEVLLEPLGIACVRVDGTDASQKMREVVARVRANRETVAFIMPAGLDRIPADEPAERIAPRSPIGDTVSEGALAAAVRALQNAQNPLILAGMGAIDARAGDAVAALAERVAAHVTTSVPASGIIGDHPLSAGQFGGFSVGATEKLILDADVIVAVGASLNTFQSRSGALIDGRTVIRIDTDSDRRITGDIAQRIDLVGDAQSVTRTLCDRLGSSGFIPRPVRELSPLAVADDRSMTGAIDPRTLSLVLDELLPLDRRIIVDNGHFGAFPMIYLTHRAPRSLIWLPDFGAVGSALAAAYASATVDSHTQSVLFIGDCGLYMTLGDLETAVRERTPLIIVCMNDGAAGSELVHMGDWGVPGDQAIFGYADLAAVARGMGAQGASVRTLADLKPALEAWDRSTGPLLLDCHISRNVRSPIYDHV